MFSLIRRYFSNSSMAKWKHLRLLFWSLSSHFSFTINLVLVHSFNGCENISEIFEQIKIRFKFSDKIVHLQYLLLNEKKKYIYILSLENVKCRDFPLGPMGKTPCFSAWVQSLGGELLSCMPQAWPKKKRCNVDNWGP